MILIIAWRNIWRNPLRSSVVILAIIAGIAALSFGFGFYNGFVVDFISNSINSEYSHVQLHHPEFKKDREIQYWIDEPDLRIASIQSLEGVGPVTGRTIVNGMISSPSTANGIIIYGVDPEHEATLTRLDSAVVEGKYFAKSRNAILISSKVAEQLKTKVRSKVVLTFQDKKGDIVAGAFRVAGIIETKSPRINQSVVYIRSTDLRRIAQMEDQVHEIAFLLEDLVYQDTVLSQLKKSQDDLFIESWEELAPELKLVQSQVKINMGIILGIIMLALGFGIVNTMLMAVLERYKEIGVLMAVGMKKLNVFGMIMLETLMLAVVGGPIGFVLGVAIVEHYDTYGIDLTKYSEGLQAFGYEAILYPKMGLDLYFMIAVGVVITTLLASIYPAIKAIKLKPIEAIRKL